MDFPIHWTRPLQWIDNPLNWENFLAFLYIINLTEIFFNLFFCQIDDVWKQKQCMFIYWLISSLTRSRSIKNLWECSLWCKTLPNFICFFMKVLLFITIQFTSGSNNFSWYTSHLVNILKKHAIMLQNTILIVLQWFFAKWL